MIEFRRPRPSRGVLGYVAELEQIDVPPSDLYAPLAELAPHEASDGAGLPADTAEPPLPMPESSASAEPTDEPLPTGVAPSTPEPEGEPDALAEYAAEPDALAEYAAEPDPIAGYVGEPAPIAGSIGASQAFAEFTGLPGHFADFTGLPGDFAEFSDEPAAGPAEASSDDFTWTEQQWGAGNQSGGEPYVVIGEDAPTDDTLSGGRLDDMSPLGLPSSAAGPRRAAWAPGRASIDLSSAPPPPSRRGRRLALFTVAAMAAVVAGAAGYVVMREAEPSTVASGPDAPIASAPLLPSDGTGFEPGAGNAPVGTGAARAPASAVATTTPVTGRSADGTAEQTTPVAGRDTRPPARRPAPPAPAYPPDGQQQPAGPWDPPTDTGNAPVTAAYSYLADSTYGYLGSVTLTNSGDVPVRDWRVQLAVKGRGRVTVTSGDVVAVRQGRQVVFTPAPGADPIPAWGSLTYTFGLESLPSGCVVDGIACL